MAKINRIITCFLLLLFSTLKLAAQQPQIVNPDNADMMRSNGKIYVVVAVCLTILVSLFGYLFLIDRRLSRLEKENKIPVR